MEQTVEYRSRNPHQLSEMSFGKMLANLDLVDPKSAVLIRSLQAEANDQSYFVEMLADLRHRIYALGLGGGHARIESDAKTLAEVEQGKEGLSDPIAEEDGETFSERMRRFRTEISLALLSDLEEGVMERELGLLRARYAKLDAEIALRYINPEAGKWLRIIDQNTPINHLLNIVALAENPEFEEIEICKRAKLAAAEHLIRKLVTDNIKPTQLKFFKLEDYQKILRQMPGNLSEGRIGEKSSNLILAEAALRASNEKFDDDFAKQHGMTRGELLTKIKLSEVLKIPESYYVGAQLFADFMSHNGELLASASELKTHYMNGDPNPEELHAEVKELIMKANFPAHLERQLRVLFSKLNKLGPIIVRSTSSLEDRSGASFSGKYDSVMLANSGDFWTDYTKFLEAMKRVYASVFGANPFEFRAQHDLICNDEEMGLLVQPLVGEQHGKYFYPHFSLVAMSRAIQSLGLDHKKGCMTIGAGLGEGVVGKGGKFVMHDNPRKDFQSKIKDTSAKPYMQTKMAVLNLETGKIEHKSASELEAENSLAEQVVSYGSYSGSANLIDNKFVSEDISLTIEYITQKLKAQLGEQIDAEFTVNRLSKMDIRGRSQSSWEYHLLQARPQNIPENLRPCRMPSTVSSNRILLETTGSINATYAQNKRYIFFVDPSVFDSDPSTQEALCDWKKRAFISSYLNVLNERFNHDRKGYVIVTQGRWGSDSTAEEPFTIPGHFSHYSNTGAVLEVMLGDAQSSQGMHAFNDYSDQGIAVGAFPEEGVNLAFFRQAEHSKSFPKVPEALKGFVKMVDLEEICPGLRTHLAQSNVKGYSDGHLYLAESDKDLPIPIELE